MSWIATSRSDSTPPRSATTSSRSSSSSWRSFPASPRATTTTSRSPTRCAIACCTAGCARRAPTSRASTARSSTCRPSTCSGRSSANNLLSLGIEEEVREALTRLGLDLDELIEHEEEPGLGNGGLGRLAACFMDSLATLEHPGHRPRHPLRVRHLRSGHPRRLAGRDDRPLAAPRQPVGGAPLGHRAPGRPRRPHRARRRRARGAIACAGSPSASCRACPTTRRSSATAPPTPTSCGCGAPSPTEEFDLEAFQVGDYVRAVDDKVRSENITKVLYPNDTSAAGKQLRLEQEYFFVSCALQDCIRLLLQKTTIRRVRRQVRHPAQRHAPGARGARADAPAHGRARPELGRGLGA